MSPDVLSREQQSALERLARAGVGSSYYLAGGVGLALRLAHRRSTDFDFFCPDKGPVLPLRDVLMALTGFRVLDERAGTLHGELDGVKVSFLAYPYPLLDPTQPIVAGIPVASLHDLAAMKLSAIISRGRRRDFMDLHAICRLMDLEEVVSAFRRKSGAMGYNPLTIAKALVYFSDAEQDPVPVLLQPCDWNEVKRFFEIEVRRLWP